MSLSRAELEALPRKKLQSLAKREGIRANLKNAVIIDMILEKHAETSPHSPVIATGEATTEEVDTHQENASDEDVASKPSDVADTNHESNAGEDGVGDGEKETAQKVEAESKAGLEVERPLKSSALKSAEDSLAKKRISQSEDVVERDSDKVGDDNESSAPKVSAASRTKDPVKSEVIATQSKSNAEERQDVKPSTKAPVQAKTNTKKRNLENIAGKANKASKSIVQYESMCCKLQLGLLLLVMLFWRW